MKTLKIKKYVPEKQKEVMYGIVEIMEKWLDYYKRERFKWRCQKLQFEFFIKCDRDDLHDEFIEFAKPAKRERLDKFDTAFKMWLDNWIYWGDKRYKYFFLTKNIITVMEEIEDPTRALEKKPTTCYPKGRDKTIIKEEYPKTREFTMKNIEQTFPKKKVYDR